MAIEVDVVDIEACPLAAVRTHVTTATLGGEIGRLLDVVWTYVRASDLDPNHSVVVYHGDPAGSGGTDIDVGVQVDRPFDGTTGDGLRCIELPATRVARALHRGPYDQMAPTYAAIDDHCRQHGLAFAGTSWEVYGDWNEDPALLETEIVFALAPG
jgi:effector-binding domain-containing protein